jgi:hypothetical protein
MSDLKSLTLDTTIGDLPLHETCVSHKALGQSIVKLFEQNPELPGVLIEDDSGITILISRQRFHERLSSPYGLELFLNRPISSFLEMYRNSDQAIEMLVLPHTESIESAVSQGLQRNIKNIYEPIIVIFEEDSLPGFQIKSLLDFRILLLAQSKLLNQANEEIRNQQKQTQHYLQQYKDKQEEVQVYNQQLQTQQVLIQERNKALEHQKAQLLEKTRQIQELNERFLELGGLLSSEGRKVFQATFAGVNAICRSADQIVEAGVFLDGEVKILQEISASITKVSRQVNHLSIKASIVANQSGEQVSGFSTINEEISNLLSGTFEASEKLRLVSDRFHKRIADLTQSAQMGMNVARSLISEMGEAQIAVNQLEELVRQQSKPLIHPVGISSNRSYFDSPLEA